MQLAYGLITEESFLADMQEETKYLDFDRDFFVGLAEQIKTHWDKQAETYAKMQERADKRKKEGRKEVREEVTSTKEMIEYAQEQHKSIDVEDALMEVYLQWNASTEKQKKVRGD